MLTDYAEPPPHIHLQIIMHSAPSQSHLPPPPPPPVKASPLLLHLSDSGPSVPLLSTANHIRPAWPYQSQPSISISPAPAAETAFTGGGNGALNSMSLLLLNPPADAPAPAPFENPPAPFVNPLENPPGAACCACDGCWSKAEVSGVGAESQGFWNLQHTSEPFFSGRARVQ